MQGVVIFSGSKAYIQYVEGLKNHYNAVDGTFYDAINFDTLYKLITYSNGHVKSPAFSLL